MADRPDTEPVMSRPGLFLPPSPEPDPNGYRTAPDHETTGWPPGVPYIVGNEACERFSYYGMKAILFQHLAALYLIGAVVKADADRMATQTTHLFFAGAYALPMIGAIVADRLAGKYRTILWLSLFYCAGHAVLAVAENTLGGMYLGLALIAVGAGGIKPCVSANVGDQFGKNNWRRVGTVYQIFYFSINFGSFFSTLLIPWLRDTFGAGVAFGVPGVLMFLATVVFWAGRRKYVHVPARPGGRVGLLDTLSSTALFLAVGHLFFTSHLAREYGAAGVAGLVLLSLVFAAVGLALFSYRQRVAPDDGFLSITLYAVRRFFAGGMALPSEAGGDSPLERSRFWGPAVARFGARATEGPVAVLRIMSVFLLVSVFWALFEQHSSTWIAQAAKMDLTAWGDWKVKAAQTGSMNPILVMILIPLMNPVYAFLTRRGLTPTPLRRLTVGLFITSLSFVTVALLQARIDAAGEGMVWVGYQAIAYFFLTVGEILVSITGLEFAYAQAPRRMKSTVMGFWLLMISLGNVLVVFLTSFKGLPLVQFFWLFAGLMAGAGAVFGLRAYFYVPRDYLQE